MYRLLWSILVLRSDANCKSKRPFSGCKFFFFFLCTSPGFTEKKENPPDPGRPVWTVCRLWEKAAHFPNPNLKEILHKHVQSSLWWCTDGSRTSNILKDFILFYRLQQMCECALSALPVNYVTFLFDFILHAHHLLLTSFTIADYRGILICSMKHLSNAHLSSCQQVHIASAVHRISPLELWTSHPCPTDLSHLYRDHNFDKHKTYRKSKYRGNIWYFLFEVIFHFSVKMAWYIITTVKKGPYQRSGRWWRFHVQREDG